MSPVRCTHAGVGLLLFTAAWVQIPAAAADAYADHIDRMLSDGWQSGSDALAAARSHYDRAVTADARDCRADYALALVQMKQRDFEGASQSLDAAAAKDPDDLYVWRAQVWMLVQLRKHSDAFDQLQAMTDRFPAEPVSDLKAEGRTAAAAKIIGRVVGYLETAANTSLGEQELAARAAALKAKLPGSRGRAFDAGRAEIVRQRDQLLAEIEAEKQQTVAAAGEAADEQRDLLDQQKQNVAEEMERLEAEAETVQRELDVEVSEIDRQLAPLELQYREVLARAAPIQRQIRDLQIRMERVLAESRRISAESQRPREGERRREGERGRESENRGGGEAQQRAGQEIAILQREIARTSEFLRPLDFEARRLDAEAARLQQQKAAALARYKSTMNGLNSAARKLGRTTKAGRRFRAQTRPSDVRRFRQGDRPESQVVAVDQLREVPTKEQERSRLLELR